MSWFAEITLQNRGSWIAGTRRYATSDEASAAARDLMRRLNIIAVNPAECARNQRVSQSADPVNATWNFAKSRSEEIAQ